MKVDFLQGEDFEMLIPLIKKFSVKAQVPFWQQVNEVSNSFVHENWFTIIGGDPIPTAYLCGYYLSKTEFMVSQLYSEDPEMTKAILSFLESQLRLVKVEKIIALFKHHPRTAERHGYKVERYVMVKNISKEA
jgi:hypothetical protein